MASIIIPTASSPFISYTIQDLLLTSEPGLVEEILVPVEYSANSKSPLIKYLDTTAKTHGELLNKIIDQAQSEEIIIITGGCKTAIGWLKPLVDKIQDFTSSIAAPGTFDLNPFFWERIGSENKRVGWRWNFDLGWKFDDGSTMSPAINGDCFAFTRSWHEETGKFDNQFNSYLACIIDFCLRTWMFGGQIEIVKSTISSELNERNIPEIDRIRLAEIWLDEYTPRYYTASKSERKSDNLYNISERIAKKKTMQQREIDDFLQKLQPELVSLFDLKNKFFGGSLAIICNGPSLDYIDRSLIYRHDAVIGVDDVNGIFNYDFVLSYSYDNAKTMIESNLYDPRTLVVADSLLDNMGRQLCCANSISDKWRIFELATKAGEFGSLDPPFFKHASPFHTAIHFAAFLGAKTITLIGGDFALINGRSHTKLLHPFAEVDGNFWPDSDETSAYLQFANEGLKIISRELLNYNVELLKICGI